MRFSLFVTADHLHGGLRSRHYETLEQQVIAAELHGFATVWLADGWSDVPPDLFSTVRLLHRLSAVTDRIDLGALVRLPHPTLPSRLLEALMRLDTLSGGRMRLAVDPGACAPEAALDVALSVAEELRDQGKPWLARRILLVAHESSVAQAGAAGLGMLLPPDTAMQNRHAQIACYHEARGTRPGWVARSSTVALADSDGAALRLQRRLLGDERYAARRYDPPVVGTAAHVVARLATAEIAEGLDELVCEVAPTGAGAHHSLFAIEQLGCEVVPYFATPHHQQLALPAMV